MKFRRRAFTIIELLVVITIIAVLSVVIIVSYNGVNERVKKSRAKGDVNAFTIAVKLMKQDTGEYPNHLNSFCEENITGQLLFSKEYPVTHGRVGLFTNDTINPYRNWNGPYVNGIVKDPWGNDYKFDPDYFCGGNVTGGGGWINGEMEQACDGMPVGSHVAAIISRHNPDPDSVYRLYGGGNVAAFVCKHKDPNYRHDAE